MTNLPHDLTISAGIPLYKGDSVSEVKTRLRLIADEITAHAQRDYGSLIRDSQSVRHFVSVDVESDTVYIDYIWDMRMNPVKLKRMKFDI